MKRSREGSISSENHLSSHSQQIEMAASACSHLTSAFASLNAPRPSQQVHKEECTLCFDDQDGPNGIDVCLICFNGGCTGNQDRNHSALHHAKTGHYIVLNIKRRLKPKAKEEQPQPKKLAIAAESEADKYDFIYTPKCLACEGGKELPLTSKLEEVIDGVKNALSSAQQTEVKAWEEEIIVCDHTVNLKQIGEPFRLEADGLAKCGKCELDSNLWLCLTCGNLGCGRAQFGGIGGNSHGLAHFEETGHPVSVKQGTITAEGTADIYCYACNDARLDPQLAKHLSHFGINVVDLSKTEKSMTELQLEQNLKFDFNMTGEDGKELEPVFGPGLTGLKNLGNSCYMASVLQALFSLPVFRVRYLDAYRPHTGQCPNILPATCFECQTTKIADGLLSGRYSLPRKKETSGQTSENDEGPIFQEGIRPSMFKALVGKGHEEFSTMRQQDADEFLKHLFTALQNESRRLAADTQLSSSGAPVSDPTKVFSFGLQQRLQCQECKKVRYTVEAQDAGLSLPVPIRVKDKSSKGKASIEGQDANDDTAKVEQEDGKAEFEPVDLKECLDIFTAPETLDYRCPSCDKNVQAVKQTLFTSFPDVLAIQVRRFQLINWVPQKVDVPIIMPVDGSLSLDAYMGNGKQEGEIDLPEEASPQGSNVPTFDAGAMSQLIAMGFPEVRCQRALLETGNTGDAESALNWLFSHMEDSDIDDPIDFSKYQSGTGSSGGAGGTSAPDTFMLEEMGFSKAQARKALRLNGNNPEIAVAWLFENPGDAGDGEDNNPATTSQGAGESSVANVIGGRSELPANYRLKAFISHKGPSVHSGHYVAHISEPNSIIQAGRNGTGQNNSTKEDSSWVFFNDEKVVLAPLTTVSQKDPSTDVGVQGLSKLAYEYIWVREG